MEVTKVTKLEGGIKELKLAKTIRSLSISTAVEVSSVRRRAESTTSMGSQSTMDNNKSASVKCFFLDILPTELRLHIYEYLLVAQEPIRGRTARKEREYGLDIAILGVNKQIHDEAKNIFLGRNTFYISSLPEEEVDPSTALILREDRLTVPAASSTPSLTPKQQQSFQGRLDPPLQIEDLPLLRHLIIDLLYYPRHLETVPGPGGTGWKPIAPRATVYINALVTLLSSLPSNLQTLRLTADATSTPLPFCIKKCLTAFFMCDHDRRFSQTLASLHVPEIPVSFELPECYFRISVGTDVFLRKSILLLACQVFFCQSQLRIMGLIKDFGDGREEDKGEEEGETNGANDDNENGDEDGDGSGSAREKTNLAPFVDMVWTPDGRLAGGVSVQDLGLAV